MENYKNLKFPDRKSIRHKGYDYASPGGYFITLCVDGGRHLFGEVGCDAEMNLNITGKMIDDVWKNLPKFYPCVELDVYQIMPNHMHGIIIIKQSGKLLSLSEIIKRFKTITTKFYLDRLSLSGLPQSSRRFWQRNFWERIIREHEWYHFQNYIIDNPKRWNHEKNIKGSL